MSYTMKNLPEDIKKLPKAKQEQWLATFNAVLKEKGESDALATANAAVKEAEGFKDSMITDLKESAVADVDVGYISMREAKFNDDFSQVEVTLIEQGCNEQKKRVYPDKTIKEAAPIFKGMKMYLNHPTAKEEAERPERDLKDWVSTITESRYEGGKALGLVAVHDPWLRERLADPVAREHIGLSINAGGKIAIGKFNGKEGYQIVEQIIPARKNGPASVDWVTEAGARGRVNRLLESNRGDRKMSELKDATLKEVKLEREDLVEAISKEAVEPVKKELEGLKTQLQEANGKIKAMEDATKLSAQNAAVEKALKEAQGIPEPSKERIKAQFSKLVEGNLQESLKSAIASELDYVNKIVGKGKVKTGTNETKSTDLHESLQKGLDERAGVAEKEKEETK
jgi:hypothetical protein